MRIILFWCVYRQWFYCENISLYLCFIPDMLEVVYASVYCHMNLVKSVNAFSMCDACVCVVIAVVLRMCMWGSVCMFDCLYCKLIPCTAGS